MSSKQAFFGLIALTVLAVAATAFVVSRGASMLAQKGDALVELKLQNEVLDKRRDMLIQANQDIKNYAELEAIAKSIVPQEKDQARTVREITTIASESGISLASIQFPSSALGEVQRRTSRNAPPRNPAASQLNPVEGIKDLYAMEITIQSASSRPVTYSQLLNFLERLEQNRRTAHVINLSINPSSDDRNFVTFSVVLNVYIKL